MSTHNICFYGEIRKIYTWSVRQSGAMSGLDRGNAATNSHLISPEFLPGAFTKLPRGHHLLSLAFISFDNYSRG